jgi:hypothetical protein
MSNHFHPGLSDLPSRFRPFSPLLHNTTSNTRILGRRRFLTRHHTPTNLLSGQATWLRCRVLDEPLAIPWCRNLACNAVMWRSRPDIRSSLWMVVQCLSVVCSLTLRLFTDRMPSFCRCSIFFFCMTLHCWSPDAATKLSNQATSSASTSLSKCLLQDFWIFLRG